MESGSHDAAWWWWAPSGSGRIQDQRKVLVNFSAHTGEHDKQNIKISVLQKCKVWPWRLKSKSALVLKLQLRVWAAEIWKTLIQNLLRSDPGHQSQLLQRTFRMLESGNQMYLQKVKQSLNLHLPPQQPLTATSSAHSRLKSTSCWIKEAADRGDTPAR